VYMLCFYSNWPDVGTFSRSSRWMSPNRWFSCGISNASRFPLTGRYQELRLYSTLTKSERLGLRCRLLSPRRPRIQGQYDMKSLRNTYSHNACDIESTRAYQVQQTIFDMRTQVPSEFLSWAVEPKALPWIALAARLDEVDAENLPGLR
jgi:hypothetical protein